MENSTGKPFIILCGSSCAGKSVIATSLKKCGLKEVISYTTRQPRLGEVNGKDYHFCSNSDFEKLSRFMLEHEEVHKGIYYGSLKNDYSKRDFIILTPECANEVKQLLKDRRCIVVHMTADEDILIKRIVKNSRNKTKERIERISEEKAYLKYADIILDTSIKSKYDIFCEFETKYAELCK